MCFFWLVLSWKQATSCHCPALALVASLLQRLGSELLPWARPCPEAVRPQHCARTDSAPRHRKDRCSPGKGHVAPADGRFAPRVGVEGLSPVTPLVAADPPHPVLSGEASRTLEPLCSHPRPSAALSPKSPAQGEARGEGGLLRASAPGSSAQLPPDGSPGL